MNDQHPDVQPTHRVQLVVEHFGHTRRCYQVRHDQGWKVDTERRVIVIGRGLPRTEIPLDNVLSWDVEELPTKPVAAPERRRVDPLNLDGRKVEIRLPIAVAQNGCDDCSVEPGEHHRYANCPGNLRGVERQFDNAMAASERAMRAGFAEILPTHDLGPRP